MSNQPLFTSEDFPYGLRCMNCGEKFIEGQPYSKRLVGLGIKWFVTEIVCVVCGLGLPEEQR